MGAGARRQRHITWGLSWLAYASYYAGRKGFGASKKALHDGFGISEAGLGLVDTGYLTTYALGQFASGWLGDRVGARRLVGYGMLLSSGACVAFGMSVTTYAFALFLALNGLAQSTGWPGTTRAMAEWTTPTDRGTVMALWSTCYQFGGIAASWAAGWLLAHYGWRSAFFGPALWMALVGLAVLCFLKSPSPEARPANTTPEARPLSAAPEAQAPSPTPSGTSSDAERRLAQRLVFRNPLLWCYGGSYFFIKFIRYALLFWLPYYLSKKLHYSQELAAYVSTAFEAGGIVGVVGIGTLSDRLRPLPRAVPAAVSLGVLALALAGYALVAATSVPAVCIALALVGAALFGPDSLICGAAAQDAGGNAAAATATGFVNGLGSLGAIVEGVAVPLISKHYGWDALFPCLGVLAGCAALMLLPALRRRQI